MLETSVRCSSLDWPFALRLSQRIVVVLRSEAWRGKVQGKDWSCMKRGESWRVGQEGQTTRTVEGLGAARGGLGHLGAPWGATVPKIRPEELRGDAQLTARIAAGTCLWCARLDTFMKSEW